MRRSGLQPILCAGKVSCNSPEYSPMVDAKKWLETEKIEFVECLVPDLNGVGKGKTVLPGDLINGEVRLPEAIFGQDVVGGWCEDYDLLDVTDVDMVLNPDLNTLMRQPWSKTRTAQCICDCQSLAGEEIAIAPRALLKRIMSLFNEMGMQPVVAQEAEFYLVAKNPEPILPLQAAHGVSGRQQKTPRSFQMEALSEYAPFLETLHEYCKVQNIVTSGIVQEMGRGQLEVNFKHGDALQRADEMFNFKRVARQVALDQGYYATFLSKPMTSEPGSAMHLHQSIVDLESGKNLFANDDGSYSEHFNAYLGGLQKYTRHVMAILAPNVNSYRRFDGAESCPTNVEWGVDNRTTGFRVPRGAAVSTRIENRIPGSDTNPYLAIAVSLACGYLGIKEGLSPSEPISESAWDLAYTMPRTLRESLGLLLECEPLAELLGDRFVKLFVDLKQREVDAFSAVVTAWEREHLLLTV
jgi:glutamine synthetase